MKKLSINADVGEGIADEEKLFPYLDLCNIACGGHYGTEETVRRTVDLSVKYAVAIGAHPSYPDKENFGRVSLALETENLKESIYQQVRFFSDILKEKNQILHHIKPHGALYNDVAKDPHRMHAFLDAIQEWNKVKIVLPYAAPTQSLVKERGFSVLYEAFLDRTYEDDYSLTPRSRKGAVIHNIELAKSQAETLRSERIQTTSGKILPMHADTYCIHGDNPAAIDILKRIEILNSEQ